MRGSTSVWLLCLFLHLLHLAGFSFEPSPGQVTSLIQQDFPRHLPGGGHWSLGFPRFDAGRSFAVVIAVEKDVSAAGNVVVGVMADFLLLFRGFGSHRGLSGAGENSVLLQL